MQYRYQGTDDNHLIIERNDFSGGVNTRQAADRIAENQMQYCVGYDISIPGEIRKDKGAVLIEDLTDDSEPGTGIFAYEPGDGQGQLVVTHGQKLETWDGAGPFVERKNDFTDDLGAGFAQIGESGKGDVFVVGNGTDNWFRFDPNDLGSPQDLGNTTGTGADSPPKSSVSIFFRNRWWVLKDLVSSIGNLWFSDAYDEDYSQSFDTVTNGFRIPVGSPKALIGLRELGIIVMGDLQIWGVNPSLVPDPEQDKPEKILDIGCVASKTAVQVGDDIVFLSSDGVRGLFRTQQDKVQTGRSYPLSYILKAETESINWSKARHTASAVYFDNKYMISLPVHSSQHNNQVWIYYPATNAWRIRDGWNVADWAVFKVNGESQLFYVDSVDSKVYRAFFGDNDNGENIFSSLITRQENMGYSQQYKVGGEFEIRYRTTNEDADLKIYASLDNQGYQLIGTIKMKSGKAPILPIELPFLLADNYTARQKIHLDRLGRWTNIHFKIEDNLTTGSDVIIYGYTLRTFLEEYENE